jgi:hypothetical protein
MKTFDFGKWPKNRKKVKANPSLVPGSLSLYAALIYLNTFYRFYAWVSVPDASGREAPLAVTSHIGSSLTLHPRFFSRLFQNDWTWLVLAYTKRVRPTSKAC